MVKKKKKEEEEEGASTELTDFAQDMTPGAWFSEPMFQEIREEEKTYNPKPGEIYQATHTFTFSWFDWAGERDKWGNKVQLWKNEVVNSGDILMFISGNGVEAESYMGRCDKWLITDSKTDHSRVRQVYLTPHLLRKLKDSSNSNDE